MIVKYSEMQFHPENTFHRKQQTTWHVTILLQTLLQHMIAVSTQIIKTMKYKWIQIVCICMSCTDRLDRIKTSWSELQIPSQRYV